MSQLKTSRRLPKTTPFLSSRIPGPLALALAFGITSGAAAQPGAADWSSGAAVKPVMNFVASSQRQDERRRPPSSLWTMIQHAHAGAPVNIEPAGLTSASRALSHDVPGDEEVLDIPDPLAPDVSDPLEPVNRIIFGFNEVVDFVVLTPVSHVYRTLVPEHLRTGVSNALHNWSSPVIFVNDLLQGKPEKAKTTFIRFLVNSTAGFGGIVDAAGAAGLPRHSEDFGQTLAVWGLESGPYLVLPVLGPSNFRDTVGLAVDTVTHPATWLMWNLDMHERTAPVMAYTVSGHESFLDEVAALRSTSPDFYATMRGIYAQRRAAEIANGSMMLEPVDGADGAEGVEGDDLGGIDLEALPPIPTE